MIPAVPLPCFGPLCPGSLGGIGGDVAKAAGSAVLQSFDSGLTAAAEWLVAHVMDLVVGTTKVDLDSGWFVNEMDLMKSDLLFLVLPVLMAATIGPVLRQDGRRLFRVWGVGLPVALVAGLAAAQIVDWAVAGSDALCSLFLGPGSHAMALRFTTAMGSSLVSESPTVVQLALAVLTVAGTILIWLELMVRSSAVYVATFFTPLALVGFIWPSTAAMGKRAVEILAAVIMSKFVIVASLSLGLAAVGARTGPDTTIAGAGILLLAGFAPFALVRLAPIVEAAAIAHMEGLARRPLQAGGRTAAMATRVPGNPVVRALLARAAGPGPSPGASHVSPQPLGEHQTDWPLASAGVAPGGGRDG